jgi:hypothetical protein
MRSSNDPGKKVIGAWGMSGVPGLSCLRVQGAKTDCGMLEMQLMAKTLILRAKTVLYLTKEPVFLVQGARP